MYKKVSETFIKIDSLQHFKFQDKPILRTGQNLRYNIHCFDIMLIFPN